MHCLEYISEYLAAHADGELTSSQLRNAEEHVSRCDSCRMRLAREYALKRIIHQNARPVRAPAALRFRIRAALNNAASAPAADTALGGQRPAGHYGGDESHRTPSRASAPRLRQSRIWLPLGLTGSLMVLLALFAGHTLRSTAATAEASVPAFDNAIDKYLQFQRTFQSNVPPEAYDSSNGMVYAWVEERDPVHRVIDNDSPDSAEISRSYHNVNMPDDLFDFSRAGYRIAGGRVDHLPSGGLVTYTLYQGEAGTILSLCFSDPTMAAPVGAIDWLGMRSFYAYKGYSICLTFYPTGHFVSILVTRMPVRQFLREIAGTDTMIVSQR